MISLPTQKPAETIKRDKAIKIVYCLYRVSTKNQVEENDIPMQRLACHEFANQKPGWFIKREFYERGVSGFKVSADDRDQLQELKACALRKEFDVLLVFLFDRLGRRDDETPFIMRFFSDNGIEVWSVKEGQQTFDGYVDDLMNYIRFWTAMTESIKTSIRVRTRLRQMVEEGRYTGGTTPYGYKLVPSGEINRYGRLLQKMEIVPEEAETIKLIFQKSTVEGMGPQIIADILNEKGLKTHRGCQFYTSSIRRILRNPIYCGYYYRGGVVSPRVDELQIIEDEVYNEAQKLLDSRLLLNRNKEETADLAKSKALLSKNLYCGFCGKNLIVTTQTNYWVDYSGNKRSYKRYRYMCTNRTMCRNECKGQGTFSVIKVDQIVERHMRRCLNQMDEYTDQLKIDGKYQKHLSELNRKIRNLKKKERKLTKQLKTLYSEVPDSISGTSAYNPVQLSEIINEMSDKIEKTNDKLEPLEKEIDDKQQLRLTVEQRLSEYKELLTRFFQKETGENEKRMIVIKLFEKITVSRGANDYEMKFILTSDYADFC